MTDVSDRNFGYLIAYLIPGFVVVASLAPHSPIVQAWIGLSPQDAPTVGGFLYVTLAAVAAGTVVSALRWLLIDPIHHVTGVKPPEWDFASFGSKHAAFVALAENHYRYAQHYGNLFVALVIASVNSTASIGWLPMQPVVAGAAFVAILALLFLASRDALRKYYDRTAALLGK